MDTSVKTIGSLKEQNTNLSEDIRFKKKISVCLTSRNKDQKITTSRTSTNRILSLRNESENILLKSIINSMNKQFTTPSVCRTSRNNFNVTNVISSRTFTKPSVCRTSRNNDQIIKNNNRLSKTMRHSDEKSSWYDNLEDYKKTCVIQCKPFIPININFINKADIISKETIVYAHVRPILTYNKNDYNILEKLEITDKATKKFFDKALHVYENNQYCYLAMYEASIISEKQLSNNLTDLEKWFSRVTEPKLKIKDEEEARLKREKFRRTNGYSYYCDFDASKHLNILKQ